MRQLCDPRRSVIIATMLLIVPLLCWSRTGQAAETEPLPMDGWNPVERQPAPAPRTGEAIAWEAFAHKYIALDIPPNLRDWTAWRHLSFWVHTVQPSEVPLRVVLWSELGKSYFIDSVPLDHTGWKQVDLPLKSFARQYDATLKQIVRLDIHADGWGQPEPKTALPLHLMDFQLSRRSPLDSKTVQVTPVPVDPWLDLLSNLHYTPTVKAGEPGAFDFGNWELAGEEGSADFHTTWNSCELVLNPAKVAGEAAIEREMNLDVSRYEGLRFAGVWNPQVEIKVSTWEDDLPMVEHTFHSRPDPSQGDRIEMFEVPLRGRQLKKVRLAIAAGPHDMPLAVSPTFLLGKRKVSDPASGNLIHVTPDPTRRPDPKRALPWGFIVQKQDLPAVRRNLRTGFGQTLLAAQRRMLEPYLQADVADEFNRASYGLYLRLSAHENEAPYQWSWNDTPNHVMANAAAAYLATGETRYAELARQVLLCICRTKYWTNSLQFRFPRPTEPKVYAPFVDSTYAMDVAMTMDWLGDYLTPGEMDEARRALREKALPHIEAYFRRYNGPNEFWRTTNQGLIFNGGWLLARLVQSPAAPGNAEAVRQASTHIREVFQHIAMPDGTLHEGLSYWCVSLLFGTGPLLAVANAQHKPFEEVYGESLARQFEFAAYCKSNASRSLRMFNFSDSHYGALYGVPAIFFATKISRPARWLMSQVSADEMAITRYNVSNFGLLTGATVPNEPSGKADGPDLPLAKTFPDSQMVFWRGGWSYGDPNFTFISGPIETGHHQGDKNSLTLEYGGARLLVDPGLISYADARSNQLSSDAFHNTVSIGEENQSLTPTSNGARLVKCEAGPIGYLASDASAVYPNAGRVVRTLVYSHTLRFLVCIDDVTTPKPERICANWQSLAPFAPDAAGAGYTLTREQSRLAAHFESLDGKAAIEQDKFICDSGDLFRLRCGTATPTQHARLVSVMTFGSADSPPPVVKSEASAESHTFRIATASDALIVEIPDGKDLAPGLPMLRISRVTQHNPREEIFRNAK